MVTIAEFAHAQVGDHRVGLMFEGRVWTHDQVARAAAARAALLTDRLPAGSAPHVGVLLDNVPEFPLWLEGIAVTGGTLVGVNSTRRGADLARDITHAECSMLVTERAHLPLLAGLDLGIPDERVLVVDDPAYAETLEPYADARLPEAGVDPATRLLIVFTSGSTGAPKGVVCSQGRLAGAGAVLGEQFGFDRDGVHYICMPMFHGNALLANWAPAMRARGAVALRRKFSASGFLDDIREFGATYFTYVGRAISYILATPERSDDVDNPLRNAFGTEAGTVDMSLFEQRFGVKLTEGYGSSEGGMSVGWRPGTPDRAVGPCPADAVLLDPDTGLECPRAEFDDAGRLLNGDRAIGELVNLGRNGFEGYWRNDEADRARTRDGWYWTGDRFYRDDANYLYFASRSEDNLRVDGENLSVATIEDILARFDPVEAAVVYGVPDPVSGDQVVAAFQLRSGTVFEPGAFTAFLVAQRDLGTKMPPRFVRVVERVPVTATNKVNRAGLRREGFRTAEPVWWAPERGSEYREFTDDDRAALLGAYAAHGRSGELDL